VPDESIQVARNRAYELLRRLDAALEAGEIDEEGWYREVAVVITPAYLAQDNPRAQSGHSGDDAHWEQARGLIADAIDRSGTFLDVGSASGYLMECIQRWALARGFVVEPYGLDIAPELAALARRRLPHWADRIYVGNVINWEPPRRFDFVRSGLEYVPARRHRDLVARLLRDYVAPGGRLIIGTFNEERDETRREPPQEALVASWGFTIAGRTERPHYHDPRLVYRAFWIDAPAHEPPAHRWLPTPAAHPLQEPASGRPQPTTSSRGWPGRHSCAGKTQRVASFGKLCQA
jgi:SAM-dependent methyltransferase